MPELPEVENIKRGLEPKVINKKIIDVEFSETIKLSHEVGKLAVVKENLENFATNVIGKTIEKVVRRGKYMYFELDKGYLVVHFAMTGAFFVVRDLEEITNKNYYKHKHVIFNLSTGEKLVFSDIRRFGELRYIDNIADFKPFINLAPEPFSKNAKKHFLEKLQLDKYKKQQIKPLLLDGNIFCGCGNIYACEVLYKEKINPQTLVKDLSTKQLDRLFSSLVKILSFSIEQGGSTISDFIHSDGGQGSMQDFLQIYGKKTCPKNHTTDSISQKGRTTHFCKQCQK